MTPPLDHWTSTVHGGEGWERTHYADDWPDDRPSPADLDETAPTWAWHDDSPLPPVMTHDPHQDEESW